MAVTVNGAHAVSLLARRLAAFVLDCLLVFIVVIGGIQGLAWLATRGAWFDRLDSWSVAQGWILASVVLPTLLYFSLAEAGSWQATLGKRLLGLRVGDLAGRRLSLPRAFARNALKLVPWVVVHLGILVPTGGGVAAIGSPSSPAWWWVILAAGDALTLAYLVAPLAAGGSRGIHDWLAGTQVRPIIRPTAPRTLRLG